MVKEFSSQRIPVPILSSRFLSRYCKARLYLISLKFDMFGFFESFSLVVSRAVISKSLIVISNLSILDVADGGFKVLFSGFRVQSMQSAGKTASSLPA